MTHCSSLSVSRYMRLAALGSLALFAGSSALALAGEFEQHAAHDHGRLTLNVAVDAQLFQVELDAPAINVVGFEHAPANAAETQRIADAEQWLRSGRNIVAVPPSAGCSLQAVQFEGPAWSAEPHDGEHGDYHVTFRYRCRAPAALTWFEPWLLQRLIGVQQTIVNIITPSLQTSRTLGPDDKRVSLR